MVSVVAEVILYEAEHHRLLCKLDGLGPFPVDPFVSCAIETGAPGCDYQAIGRGTVGKKFIMDDYWCASDGVYIPAVFDECEP